MFNQGSASEPISSAFGEERSFMRCPRCLRAYELAERFCSVDDTPLIPSTGRTLLGRLLANRYRLQERLGSGGMGEVYKAWHVLLEKPLAIKVVLPSFADRSTAVALLQREAKNASRVEHPNVVRVHDLEYDGGILFLTMDFVPGPTLSEIVERTGPLAPAIVSEIVDGVASGLEAIHGMGIVHRDLKPSNVVLTRVRDGAPIAKLLDFGISRAFDDPDQSITRSGLVVGTPLFMSPEQRSGLPLDKRADVFALGVLATYLLAGSLPRIGPGTCLRLADVQRSAEWPEGLRHLLLHALMWERTQRTASAQRFANALRDVVKSIDLPSSGPITLRDLMQSEAWRTTPGLRPTPVGRLSPPPPPPPPPPPSAPARLDRTAEFAKEAHGSRTVDRGSNPSASRGPRVVAIGGPLRGSEFAVTEEALLLGRDPRECQIVFPESASLVSRIHASLLWNAAIRRFVLRDEGSKNSTFVNGSEQIEPDVPVELPEGSTFAVGHPDNLFRLVAD